MEGIQILIYIVIAIIYLIVKGINKATNSNNADLPADTTLSEPPANLPPRKTGPTSFEDLLNEFGEAINKTNKSKEINKQEPATVKNKTTGNTSNNQQKTSQKTTTTQRKKSTNLPSYQSTLSQEQVNNQEYVPVYRNEADAVDYEIPGKAAYAGLDDHKKRFAAFDIPAADSNTSKYAQLLKNSQSVRTAFILSEILKRKYQ